MKKKRTKKVTNKISTSNQEWINYQLPQPHVAKYLVVVVDRGMASEVNHFTSLEEAKRAFGEIARDYGYEPEEINDSDKYDVSVWEWTGERYEKVCLY
ncbi:MAG: hypothetical protein E3K37_12275 [Candidatus Kuenenia sp.]|nr:hypothetical protein [Candidatus Kuenenia hertensis]